MKYCTLRYYKSFLCEKGVMIGTLIEDEKGIEFIFTKSCFEDIKKYDKDINMKFIEANLLGIQKEVEEQQPNIESYISKYVNEYRFDKINEINKNK